MSLHIRDALLTDITVLEGIAAAMGAHHEKGYFARCLQEQTAGRRLIFMALHAEQAVGYVQLNWHPVYTMFRRLDVPEIQDLNIIPAARRQGFGELLVEYCEIRAKQNGKTHMGISVGLYASYGPAQRLYVRRGYVPDGAGVAADDEPLKGGEVRAIDDSLTLKLIKAL
jgi:GNAT superfamily N-acetyltransferase